MQLLNLPRGDIARAILSLFREARELSAEEVHIRVKRGFFDCSQRAIYKELGILCDKGILIKAKGCYSASITWLLTLLEFGNTLYKTALQRPPRHIELPSPGKKLRFKFRDLELLDRLWLQFIFLLFERSKSRLMFAWVPYFWFDLVHYHKDLEAQEAMHIAGNKMYLIVGSRTYLDQLPTKYWSKRAYTWSYSLSPFESERSSYYDLIDDYVLTVTIDEATTRRIHAFFHSIRGAHDLKRLPEFAAIKSNARATLAIENTPAKARKLRRKFSQFFGIKEVRDFC
ncbi:MAG: hypothetical protein DCC75_03490 [Proteobacteria bacterium]|nr:MAG: hypothetical protein DCC75_03490 [Pseudomonadota bacterium]